MLLRRAAALWLAGRLMVAAFALLAARAPGAAPVTAANIVRLGVVTGLAFSALVAGLTLLDVARRHEAILLANLGVSRAGVFGLALLPPLLGETLTCLLPV